jgi:hypothetical protein
MLRFNHPVARNDRVLQSFLGAIKEFLGFYLFQKVSDWRLAM